MIVNRAEISSAEAPGNFEPVDVDSTPDSNDGNDAGGDVNTATDDSINNEGGDEDDADPEDVIIEVNYDLALIKTLAPGQLQ